MKLKYVSIVLVLLLVAALAVSGCTTLGGLGGNGGNGGFTGTAAPTAAPGETEPTATPGEETPTAAPTSTPTDIVRDTLSSLYNIGQVKMYEYRMTMNVEGQDMTSTMKVESLGSGVDPKDGKTKEHYRMTSTTNIPELGPQTQSNDFYIDPNEPSDSDSSAGSYMTSNAKLVNKGPEVVTIDGKTYACTKYEVTEDGDTSYFWHSPQAPVPVKYVTTSDGTTITTELLSWS